MTWNKEFSMHSNLKIKCQYGDVVEVIAVEVIAVEVIAVR